MNRIMIEKAIQSAAVSLSIEGLMIESEWKLLCRLLLEGKLSMAEYLEKVMIYTD